MKRCLLFGLEFTNEDPNTVYDFILNCVLLQRSLIIVTPNIDHIVRIQGDSELKAVYQSASLCLNDSRVLSLLTKLFLRKRLTTITGSDLTEYILNQQVTKQYDIAIVGCRKGQIKILADKFDLKGNISHYQPIYDFIEFQDEVRKAKEFILRCPARLVFIAVGSPQQEILASELIGSRYNKIVLCIGASINYLTGAEVRAPKILQKLCLEWAFRFLHSPIKRFRRYFLNCPKILKFILLESRKASKGID